MSQIKVKPGLGNGHYDLYLDGERVGAVRKKVEHYNLARSVTSIEWILTVKGERRGGHRTRKDAVAFAEQILLMPDGTPKDVT